jgi:hypothetical protein
VRDVKALEIVCSLFCGDEEEVTDGTRVEDVLLFTLSRGTEGARSAFFGVVGVLAVVGVERRPQNPDPENAFPIGGVDPIVGVATWFAVSFVVSRYIILIKKYSTYTR